MNYHSFLNKLKIVEVVLKISKSINAETDIQDFGWL